MHRYPCTARWLAGCGIGTTIVTVLVIGLKGALG